jgi:hypothetical protein
MAFPMGRLTPAAPLCEALNSEVRLLAVAPFSSLNNHGLRWEQGRGEVSFPWWCFRPTSISVQERIPCPSTPEVSWSESMRSTAVYVQRAPGLQTGLRGGGAHPVHARGRRPRPRPATGHAPD